MKNKLQRPKIRGRRMVDTGSGIKRGISGTEWSEIRGD